MKRFCQIPQTPQIPVRFPVKRFCQIPQIPQIPLQIPREDFHIPQIPLLDSPRFPVKTFCQIPQIPLLHFCTSQTAAV